MLRLSQFSIKKQFKFILFSLLSLCMILTMLSYATIDKLMTKNANAYALNIAQKFNGEMQYMFKRVDSIFTNLLFDPNIEELMLLPYSQDTIAYIKSLLVQFSSYSIQNQDIVDIALVTKDMGWSNFFDKKTLQSLVEELLGQLGTKSFGLRKSPLKTCNISKDQHLVFGHNVYGMHNNRVYGKYLGSIVISIDPAKSSITLPVPERGSTYFLLADWDTDTFLFNCPEALSEEILLQCGNLSSLSSDTTHIIKTHDFLIYVTPVPDSGYYMISAIDRHELHKDVIFATIVTLLIVVAAFLVIVALMHTILRNMVTPLGNLSQYITHIKGSVPGTPKLLIELDGCSEIRTLNESFNELLLEQDRLNAELYETTVNLYEAKLEKKQAELDFLRSQINPHFLYNALESAKDIATERNVPEIAAIACAMGRLFRYNVEGCPMVPLEQEIEITKAYLDIQKVRFPQKLDVIYSIRENTLRLPIMKFLLQPLVENAVYHGLEPKTGKGTLFIGARIEDNCLIISIYDDGVGITAFQLNELKQDLKNISKTGSFTGRHIGLSNVQHRILLKYGADYGLSFESHENEGTKILLRIPVENEI